MQFHILRYTCGPVWDIVFRLRFCPNPFPSFLSLSLSRIYSPSWEIGPGAALAAPARRSFITVALPLGGQIYQTLRFGLRMRSPYTAAAVDDVIRRYTVENRATNWRVARQTCSISQKTFRIRMLLRPTRRINEVTNRRAFLRLSNRAP